MAKYEVWCYETHEQCQYGRRVECRPKDFNDVQDAIRSAKAEYKDARGRIYQVMVYNKDKMVVAIRGGRVYYFLGEKAESKLKEKVEVLVSFLRRNNNAPIFRVMEENGVVNIDALYDESSEPEDFIYKDVFNSGSKEIIDCVNDLIEVAVEYGYSQIKSIVMSWNTEGARCYYASSKQEKGSVDLYINWF